MDNFFMDIERYHDLYQSLNLSDDFLFSKVMQDEEILRILIEKTLDFKVKKVSLIQPQKIMEIDPGAHGIRLDVYADDDNNTRYSVEMQKSNEYNIPKRSRYYLSVMDLDQLEKGMNYNDLKNSFVIFICLFDPFNKRRQKYTFKRRCMEIDDLLLNDESNLIVLTNSDDEYGNADISAFFKYIVNSTAEVAESSDSDFIKMIHDRVVEVKNNRNLEVDFVKLLERDRENFNAGKKEGTLQTRQDIVKNMLSKGIAEDLICEIVGCTKEFVDNIRD